MSKPTLVPLSSDLIATKGSAAPVAAPRVEAVEPLVANDLGAKKAKPAAVAEPIVTHNFRVKKSFKRAFDQAAFDAEMNGVQFLQHLFAFYQQHHKGT
jgi:hypothetical protein